jgi:aminoglycoside 3-N-acetyltransferase
MNAAADRGRLARELAAAGVPTGCDVLVHCSLRALGPVAGGPATLLDAVRDVIGPGGTVVVPAQTSNNSTTSAYFRAATAGLDADQVREFEASMPGFDPATTPSYGVGTFAEYVRTHPEAVRSHHPQTSFAAVGPSASALMATHRLESHLGDESPLGALYTAGAWIVLLGVGFDRCTAFHLAEYRLPSPPTRGYRCYVQASDGSRQLCHFIGLDLDDSDFNQLGEWIATHTWMRSGPVGRTRATVLPLVHAVDGGVKWLSGNR